MIPQPSPQLTIPTCTKNVLLLVAFFLIIKGPPESPLQLSLPILISNLCNVNVYLNITGLKNYNNISIQECIELSKVCIPSSPPAHMFLSK